MESIINFNDILALSKKLETERLDRELSVVMVDEYKIDDQLRKSLKNDTYQFPDTFQTKTDKQILTRVQDQFSAKIHIKRTPVYFHKHDFVEILYIYKGHCKQFIENLETCIVLQEGDLFMLNQNVIHALQQEDEQSVLIKMIIPMEWISYEFIQDINHKSALFDFFVSAKSPQREYYNYLQYCCVGDERRLIEGIMTEYYLKQRYFEAAIKIYLQLLMIFLEREQKKYKCCRYRLSYSSLQAGEIIQYIYNHSEHITLEELAHVFSFNQSYLSRVIKENCKMNFQELVRESRLEKAAVLLSSSDYSVEKIAQAVGYQNAVPIYQGIKEKFGCSPAEYRKSYGKMSIENSTNQ